MMKDKCEIKKTLKFGLTRSPDRKEKSYLRMRNLVESSEKKGSSYKVEIAEIEGCSLNELKDFLLKNLEKKINKKYEGSKNINVCYWESDFPMTCCRKDGAQIFLTTSTKKYLQQRFFQMAHEIVHLLEYNINWRDTTNLEEGFATFNSIIECKRLEPPYNAESGKYKKPLDILRKLGDDGEVYSFIKGITRHGYDISYVPFEYLKSDYSHIWSEEDIKFLVKKAY